MPSVIDLYEKLSTAPDDKARARIIAEAFEALEERYPNLSDMATRQDLRETELRLLKEIEQVRADLKVEIEHTRADLTEKIEQTRADLTEKIEQTRADLKIDLSQAQLAWLKWSFLFWATQFGAILLLIWRVWPKG